MVVSCVLEMPVINENDYRLARMPVRPSENENGSHVEISGGRPGIAEKRRCVNSFSRTHWQILAWPGDTRRPLAYSGALSRQ